MHQKNPSAFSVLVSVFFFWGFVAAGNDILIPVFKKSLDLQNWQSQLINFAFYMAYSVGSLLYMLHARFTKKDIVMRLGYQKSIALGLLISAMGTLLFLPAAEYNSYFLMLGGLFVVGLGFSLQQTAANPFAILLGNPSKGSQRLSLAGGINNIGTTIGPLILAFAIFGTVKEEHISTTINDVKQPYLFLGLAFLFAALLFLLSARKGMIKPGETPHEEAKTQTDRKAKSIFSFPQLTLGMLGIFFYVGVEVATAGNLGAYMQSEMNWSGESSIAPFVALYWASLMIGRWVSSASVFTDNINIRFLLKIFLPFAAFGLFIIASYIAGYDIHRFWWYLFVIPVIIIADLLSKDDPAKQLLLFSLLGITALFIGMFTTGLISVFALISVGLFCSTLWPCVYTLATKGLGENTSKGSSLLILMIMGGAIISLTQGILADISWIGIRYSFITGVVCFLYLSFYALKMKVYFKK